MQITHLCEGYAPNYRFCRVLNSGQLNSGLRDNLFYFLGLESLLSSANDVPAIGAWRAISPVWVEAMTGSPALPQTPGGL